MYKRKKFLAVVILAFAMVFVAVLTPFSFGSVGSVEAASVLDSDFATRFGAVALDGDGTVRLNANDANSVLSIQSMFLSADSAANGNIVNDPDRPAQAVFSASEMNRITSGETLVYTPADNNAGFVILDNLYTSQAFEYNNYVVFSLKNLVAAPDTNFWYNGVKLNISSTPTSSTEVSEALHNIGTIFQTDNSNYCGVFKEPGYYEFQFSVVVSSLSAPKVENLCFGFFIADITNYPQDDMPVFPLGANGQPVKGGLPINGFTRQPVLNSPNAALPANGDRYYYNFQGDFPQLTYRNDKFETVIKKNEDSVWNTVTQGNDGDDSSYTFKDVGEYSITAQMLYKYGTAFVKVPTSRYNICTYSMNVFGYQGFFQDARVNQDALSWFGGADDGGGGITNCDITKQVTSDLSGSNPATEISGLITNIAAHNLIPVVTNMPPVYLLGSGTFAKDNADNPSPLSRIAFKPSGSDTWTFSTYKNDIGHPFYSAGDYAVILYYNYFAANNDNRVYSQAFYFRIDAFATNVNIIVNGESESFADLMLGNYGDKMYMTSAEYDIVYRAPTGPYEVAPSIDLYFQSAVSSVPNQTLVNFNPSSAADYNKVTAQKNNDRYWLDGTYTWRVYYYKQDGTRFMPYRDFVMTVDSTKIMDFVCSSTGEKLDSQYMPAGAGNLSVFGEGEASLSWGPKASGMGMKTAQLDFYAINPKSMGMSEANSISQAVQAAAAIMPKTTVLLQIETITDNKGILKEYRIAEKLAATGIYVISVTDMGGNISTYTFIISDIFPAFAQTPGIPQNGLFNIQPTSPSTTVAFGNSEWIAVNATINPSIMDGVPKVNSTNIDFTKLSITDSGIYIPIVKKQESTDGLVFNNITGTSVTRSAEGMYYYKITDALGNTATHYLQINPDLTQPMVLEDDIPLVSSADAMSNSATLVLNGKISNRNYLTYSFMQATGADQQNYVSKLRIDFYEMNFKKQLENGNQNPNYPFSNSVTYQTVIDISSGAYGLLTNTRIFVPVNRTPTTKPGIYVVTRVCPNRTDTDAQKVSSYYFIVDNNPVISSANFESGVQVNFGIKTAAYKDLQKDVSHYLDGDGKLLFGNNKILQGNSAATVLLPDPTKVLNLSFKTVNKVAGSGTVVSGKDYNANTKYGNAVFTLAQPAFTGGEFTDTLPVNIAFPSLGLVTDLSKQNQTTQVFEPAIWTSPNQITESGFYDIVLRDGSGGVPWQLGSNYQPPDGNRSEILVQLLINTLQGAFYLNGNRVLQSALQPTVPAVPTSANPAIVMASVQADTGDSLKFSFTNDSESFLQPINTNFSDANGPQLYLNNKLQGLTPKASVMGSITTYEYTIPMVNVKNGDVFSVRLNSTDGKMPTQYSLLIDNTPPSANLNRIMSDSDGDRWFAGKNYTYMNSVQASAGGKLDTPDDPLQYPFRISNKFVFRYAASGYADSFGDKLFDTFKISYYEVNSNLENVSGEQQFNYADSSTASNDMTFADIVGLKPEQNRFFRIVEYDEAGNRTEYFVELRGDSYVDIININGLVKYTSYDNNGQPVSANGMGTLVSGNMINQFNGNLYFPVHCVNMTAGDISSFYNDNLFFTINCKIGSVTKNISQFGALSMDDFRKGLQDIFDASLNQGAVSFIIDNGFQIYSVEIRNINADTGQINVGSPQPWGSGIRINVNAGGLNKYTDGYFWASVYDYNTGVVSGVTLRSGISNGYIVLENASHDYLVTITDEFGRVTKFAYNGGGSTISVSKYSAVSDGKYYYGSDGTSITYNSSVYNQFNLYRDDVLVYSNGAAVGGFDLNGIVSTTWDDNLKTVTILPETGRITKWRFEAIERGTGLSWQSALPNNEFYFYTVLPQLSLANPSGDDLTEKLTGGEPAQGIVVVTYSNVGFNFISSAGYTRTYNGVTSYTPIGSYMLKFNLSQSGDYVVELVNELGARSTYSFSIDDATNKTFKVKYNGELISPSPQRYGNELLPWYFVNAANESAVTSGISIYPTTNITLSTDTPPSSAGNNTLIYSIIATATGTPLKFAVTYITSGYDLGNVKIVTTDATGVDGVGWQTNNTSVEERFKYYYQNLPQNSGKMATGYISVSLNSANLTIPGSSAQGDILFTDYYRNGTRDGGGEYCGTLVGKQELIINAEDYGYYTFYVYDCAGNTRIFGMGEETADYFTLINAGRGPLVISSIADGVLKQDAIIDDMVYQDGVALSVMDIPYQVFGDSTSKYPYVSSFDVTRNNVYRDDLSYNALSKSDSKTSFVLNEPGFYQIQFTYVPNPGVSILSRYNFTIVSSNQNLGQQTFSFNATSKMQITGISKTETVGSKLVNTDLRKNYPDRLLKNIALDSSTGIGMFTLTVQLDADNIYSYVRTRSFVVYIKNVPDNGIAGVKFGTAVSGGVSISINSHYLYSQYGETELWLLHNGKLDNILKIGITEDAENDDVTKNAFTVSAAGNYQVYLVSSGTIINSGLINNGSVYFADGFKINAPTSFITIFFYIIIGGIIAAAVFLYIKMRVGLKVR